MSGTKSGFVGVLQSALRRIRAFEEALESRTYDDLHDRVSHLEARSLHSMHSSANRGWEPMSKQGLPNNEPQARHTRNRKHRNAGPASVVPATPPAQRSDVQSAIAHRCGCNHYRDLGSRRVRTSAAGEPGPKTD